MSLDIDSGTLPHTSSARLGAIELLLEDLRRTACGLFLAADVPIDNMQEFESRVASLLREQGIIVARRSGRYTVELQTDGSRKSFERTCAQA